MLRPSRHAQAEGGRAERRAAPARQLRRLHRRRQPGSGKALVETERRVDQLAEAVDALRRGREKVFRPPLIEWIKDRLNNIQQVLEQRTGRSAQVLRGLLGPISLELVAPDRGRPVYRAIATVDALALIEEPPPAGAEGGSNSLQRGDGGN